MAPPFRSWRRVVGWLLITCGLAAFVLVSQWIWLGVTAGATVVSLGVARWARRRVRRRLRRRHDRAAWRMAEMTSWSDNDLAHVIRAASGEQLCRLWVLTGDKLRHAHLPSTLDHLSEIRRLILDELAERDPVGFAQWLADQPHKTNPRTYLKQR